MFCISSIKWHERRPTNECHARAYSVVVWVGIEHDKTNSNTLAFNFCHIPSDSPMGQQYFTCRFCLCATFGGVARHIFPCIYCLNFSIGVLFPWPNCSLSLSQTLESLYPSLLFPFISISYLLAPFLSPAFASVLAEIAKQMAKVNGDLCRHGRNCIYLHKMKICLWCLCASCSREGSDCSFVMRPRLPNRGWADSSGKRASAKHLGTVIEWHLSLFMLCVIQLLKFNCFRFAAFLHMCVVEYEDLTDRRKEYSEQRYWK